MDISSLLVPSRNNGLVILKHRHDSLGTCARPPLLSLFPILSQLQPLRYLLDLLYLTLIIPSIPFYHSIALHSRLILVIYYQWDTIRIFITGMSIQGDSSIDIWMKVSRDHECFFNLTYITLF